jgi:hypothetical protein
MKNLFRPALLLPLLPVSLLAVYAPIPEQDQGKALSYHVGAATYHDSNIFGGATGEIDSMVYNFSAGVGYNGSFLSDQTFLSLGYELSNDHVVDRPGKQNLTNHSLDARIAHSFSDDTNLDVSAAYAIANNPQSLLAGVPLNTDQSFKRAQLDARYATAVGPKTAALVKYRVLDVAYDNATLSDSLDRMENLAGLELSYALLPETKLVGEYRFQDIAYGTAAALKDKTSNFLMAGVDYKPGKRLLVTARAGVEDRNRTGAADSTTPYVELSSRYTYAEGSYLATGYTYTIEEASDVTNYTDTDVNRLFVNVQHRLTGALTASGSLTYEPSTLQGRRGVRADTDEETTRFGLGLTWLPTKNWTVSATFDLDRVSSDAADREQARDRLGVSGRYAF